MRHTAHIFIGESLGAVGAEVGNYVGRMGHESVTSMTHIFSATPGIPAIGEGKSGVDYDAEALTWVLNPVGPSESSSVVIASPESLKGFFDRLFVEKVTIVNPGDANELKVVFHTALYNAVDVESTIGFLSTAAEVDRKITFDIMGYGADLAALIESSADDKLHAARTSTMNESVRDLHSIKEHADYKFHRFFVVENTNHMGVALNFNKVSFVTAVGQFVLAYTECYNTLFPVSVTAGKTTGIGMSMMSIDRRYFIDYLQRKVFLSALDRENIKQEKVDINRVQNIIQPILQRNTGIYSEVFAREVESRLERKMSHSDIINEITPILDNRFAQAEAELTSFLAENDSELTLPEKKVALAMLVGQDDALLEGYLYDTDYQLIDDMYTEPCRLFVEASQMSVTDENFADDTVNLPPWRLPDVKRMKIEIMDSTRFIRRCESQLAALGGLADAIPNADKRLVDGGFRVDGITYHIQRENIEEALADYYQPANVTIKKEVDLRSQFTPIRRQGEIGSCSAFAITSIYEHILKKKTGKDIDLSERFVYYHTNVLTGLPDGGSNYKQVIDVIADKGICLEELYRYTDNIEQIQAAPDDEAFKEAQTRQIVEARGVDVNHIDITSALSEGYPVAISLKVFDSFTECGQRGGIVAMPTDEELASGEEGYHGMVIVGFSEENRCYIVRNSWGVKFGDKGYCYIPFSYIDNPELNGFCCVITRTKEGETKGLAVPKKTFSFDTADNSTLSALLKMKSLDERNRLKKREREYSSAIFDCQSLVTTLQNPSVRNGIRERREASLSESIIDNKEIYAKKIRAIPEAVSKLKNSLGWVAAVVLLSALSTSLVTFAPFFRQFRFYWWILIASFLLMGAASLICAFKRMPDDKSNTWLVGEIVAIVSPIIAGISANIIGSGWGTYVSYLLSGLLWGAFFWLLAYRLLSARLLKRELEDDAKCLLNRIKSDEKTLQLTKLRMHLAGMVIDKVIDLRTRISARHTAACSYVGNLSVWYDEQKMSLGKMDTEINPPFINLLDNDKLDSFFLANKDAISADVKFGNLLNRQGVSDDDILMFRDDVVGRVVERLEEVMSGFNMFDYLSGKTAYDFLPDPKVTMRDKLSQMDQRSGLFCHQVPNGRPADISKHLMINVPANCRQEWTEIARPFFEFSPTTAVIVSSDRLVVFSSCEIG